MKSLVHVHFGSKVPRTGVPVAYIQSPPITSLGAMTLIDLSTIIPQNTFFRQDTVIELDENILTYFVDKKGFIITDRFNSDDQPLYYKHALQQSIYTTDTGAADVAVLDQDGNQVDSSLFTYDCNKNAIYHALPPGDKVYFAVYPRVDDGNNIIESRYQELLEAHPALEEAEAEDIDECGLDADADAYIIEELDGQPYFWRIHLPRAKKYSLRYTDEGLLKPTVPNVSQQEPWYIQIQNSTILTVHPELNLFLRYALPEFDFQNFYPFPPVMLNVDVEAEEIAEGVIDLKGTHLLITNKTPLDIKIYDVNGNLTRALTTDVHKANIPVDNITWEANGVISVDESNGLAKIYRSIKRGERVTASYYHKAQKYTYTGYNFNPLFNPGALTERVILLAKPTYTDCSSTLSHVVMDADENLVSATDSDIQDWIDEGSRTLNDLRTNWVFIPGVTTNQKNYFLLGIISTHTPLSPLSASIFDARRRGGGVRDDIQSEALKIMPGANNNWDIGNFDGPNAPIAGAILIYLPESIQNQYTETQIRELASKFAAAGSYILIRYY